AAIFGASCIVLALSAEGLFTSRIWLAALADWGGRTSYSLYLFHIPIAIIVTMTAQSQQMILQVLTYFGSAAIFTTLFYSFFEKPILRARPEYIVSVDSFGDGRRVLRS